MYSTWPAMSDSRVPNVPVPEPGGESRTRIRNPSALSSMYFSSPTAAFSNLGMVSSPSSHTVAMVRSRSTSRSTTTAYRPSLPPKCSYTTGLDTPALAAISSIDVPSKPRSATRRRPMSSSCSRLSFPVMRRRFDLRGWSVTYPSLRSAGRFVTQWHRPGGHWLRPVTCHRAELPGRGGGALGLQPPGVRPAHVVGPAQLLQRPDHPGTRVELALEHTVPGAGRVGVVQVVPGLAERGDGQPGHVARLVPDLELLVAERVADRVDRPGDVVQQRDPDQAGPEERGQRAVPGQPPQAADQGGQQQRGGDQRREQLVHDPQLAVRQQGRDELLLRRLVRCEQPDHVGVHQALGQCLGVVAVTPRGVRVAFPVAVLVVPPVVGDPVEHRALNGHGPAYRQRDPQAGPGLERAVGEVPVEADGDAEPGHPVEDQRDDHVVPAEEAPAPGQRDGGDQGQQRDGDEHPDQRALEHGGRFFREIRARGRPALGGCRARYAVDGGFSPLGGGGHCAPRCGQGPEAWGVGHSVLDAYVTVTYETVGWARATARILGLFNFCPVQGRGRGVSKIDGAPVARIIPAGTAGPGTAPVPR